MDRGYPPCPSCGHRLCFMERRDMDECPSCQAALPDALKLGPDFEPVARYVPTTDLGELFALVMRLEHAAMMADTAEESNDRLRAAYAVLTMIEEWSSVFPRIPLDRWLAKAIRDRVREKHPNIPAELWD